MKMSAVEIKRPVAEASPLFKARVAGACWLMTIVAGIFGMYVSNSLILSGDAGATAANILANEALFRSGTAATLISTGSYVGATLFAYVLLKPVNSTISLLAAFFSLVGCAVWAVSCVFELTPFILLRGGQYLSVFTPEQLQAMTLMFLKIGGQASSLGIVFFGMHCLLVGYLIIRSTFIPRIVGALMMFGGLGWLTFLAPPLAGSLLPYSLAPGTLGEVTLALWLLIRGVNVGRWKEQASAAEPFVRA
jgi:Domain of unknown function (DUF4386)